MQDNSSNRKVKSRKETLKYCEWVKKFLERLSPLKTVLGSTHVAEQLLFSMFFQFWILILP